MLIAGSISITLGILYYIKTPSARFGHGMVYDDSINKIVLFGGGFQDSTSYTFYGDTWIYDPFVILSQLSDLYNKMHLTAPWDKIFTYIKENYLD